MLVPDTDNSDNVFISSSYDPSSHFEGATNEVLRLYKKITGNDLDLVNLPDDNEDCWEIKYWYYNKELYLKKYI